MPDKQPGKLVSITIASQSGGPLSRLEETSLVAGKGIPGDRCYKEQGADPDKQVTLIEEEKVAEFNRETGLDVAAWQTRRNLVTRGVNLNALLGKQFMVGETLLEGVDLCQPCATLGGLFATEQVPSAKVVKTMVDRGGLRATIVRGGTIRPGDRITVKD
jgi:MOSC domain-containing protein YiiM